MKINNDHLYHGAALTQIAEHPQFTAINSFKLTSGKSRSAFKINDEIGVYLKYAGAPKKPFDEYVFTFNREHLKELRQIAAKSQKLFLALVCVNGREICCLDYDRLRQLIELREKAKGTPEEQYTILASLKSGQKFRVYVNAPNKRKVMLGKPLLISRAAFPDELFE